MTRSWPLNNEIFAINFTCRRRAVRNWMMTRKERERKKITHTKAIARQMNIQKKNKQTWLRKSCIQMGGIFLFFPYSFSAFQANLLVLAMNFSQILYLYAYQMKRFILLYVFFLQLFFSKKYPYAHHHEWRSKKLYSKKNRRLLNEKIYFLFFLTTFLIYSLREPNVFLMHDFIETAIRIRTYRHRYMHKSWSIIVKCSIQSIPI